MYVYTDKEPVKVPYDVRLAGLIKLFIWKIEDGRAYSESKVYLSDIEALLERKED